MKMVPQKVAELVFDHFQRSTAVSGLLLSAKSNNWLLILPFAKCALETKILNLSLKKILRNCFS